ncbi:MAG: helix-turn-helix transcriptional regulator [Lentisphaeria bacterium]|nr:helix-turn-helix transcriptional regulator [Lentisphaeria bacterium]
MRLDWEHLEVKLKTGNYSRWEKGIRCSRTWRPCPLSDNDLWVFDAGSGVMNMIGGRTPLNKNSILWMRPGHVYEVEQDPDDPIGHVWFHFELVRPDGSFYYPAVEEMPETFDCFNHAHWHAMGRNIARLLAVSRRADIQPELKSDIMKTASAMLRSMLMGIDLCSGLTGSGGTSADAGLIAVQAAEYLDDPHHLFLPIQAVAKHFSLSRNRFTQIFSAFWHISPQDYQIEKRIARAKQLLRFSDFTLSGIAGSLGYSDRFFFSRQFKEKTGMSPGEFRARSAGDKTEPHD